MHRCSCARIVQSCKDYRLRQSNSDLIQALSSLRPVSKSQVNFQLSPFSGDLKRVCRYAGRGGSVSISFLT
jgi:hypothetical protein